MDYSDKIKKFALLISLSHKIVFFGGAGVSTESGIPDFRSSDGLYNTEFENEPPEYILSHSYFFDYPDKFYRFYREKILLHSAKPNFAHIFLAKLEQTGKLSAVITQNIDCLHEDAGTKSLLKLHGTIKDNHCTKCSKYFPLEYITAAAGTPRCDACGGLIKPDVVLYEEPLYEEVTGAAIKAMQGADMLITGGTSLAVYPAAYYIEYFRGEVSVIINKSKTQFDDEFDLVISEKPIGDVLADLAGLMLM